MEDRFLKLGHIRPFDFHINRIDCGVADTVDLNGRHCRTAFVKQLVLLQIPEAVLRVPAFCEQHQIDACTRRFINDMQFGCPERNLIL
jgi:hypothetical protein